MPIRNNITTQKKYGVVYTPEWIVDLILQKTPATKDLTRVKICDPSCGEGAFLVKAAAKIINHVGDKNLCAILQNNITGFDLDRQALTRCRQNLDHLLAKNGIRQRVKWNLIPLDSSDKKAMTPYFGAFDLIVGNPPYIRIQHLGAERRQKIAAAWPLAGHGCADMYIAFFELAIKLLSSGGAIGYITPNTYLRTAAGKRLRDFLAHHNLLESLIDFGPHQLFRGVSTYSLITVLRKNTARRKVSLYRFDGQNICANGKITVSQLQENGWVLGDSSVLQKITAIKKRGTPLGEIADICVGVQTLADDVFVLEKIGEQGGYVECRTVDGQSVNLEKGALLPILKASVMKEGRDIKERVIICPYDQSNLSKPWLLPEQTLAARFPCLYAYLSAHKKRLLQRDKGGINKLRWYAYGREMNLAKTLGDKILTAGINKMPNFMRCPHPHHTFYAGYAVKPKQGMGIEKLLAQLNSDDMDFFIRHTSRDYQNGWKSFAKAFIKDFGVFSDNQHRYNGKLL